MTPVERIPIKPITASKIVVLSYTVISLSDDRDTEAVNTVDLLRSCRATYVDDHDALGRSLRIRECQLGRQDP